MGLEAMGGRGSSRRSCSHRGAAGNRAGSSSTTSGWGRADTVVAVAAAAVEAEVVAVAEDLV